MKTDLLARPTVELPSFNGRVSHTAYSVAYRRTFTNIPFSREFFQILEMINGPFDPTEKALADSDPTLFPLFESRYILTDMLLREQSAKQIIEIASGLSPRGLIWTSDRNVQYIETDLYPEAMLKRDIVQRARLRNEDVLGYDNHFIESANAAQSGALSGLALRYFDEVTPIHFTCEGLLRYLNWVDKRVLGNEIRECLACYGADNGSWITPDLEFLDDADATPESRERYDMTAQQWKFDVRPFLFKNLAHARDFFERELGFRVKVHSHLSIANQLSCPARLGLSKEAVEADLSKRYTFVMTI